ncbi:MAG: hypothetical protein IT581_12220 [Verrucomicrobiales bacterium]|nr:hypothetical protein [Verrucomicrobiales bacterium]
MDASAYSRFGNGIATVMLIVMVLFVVFVPLGVWKAVELLLWVWEHLEVAWK